MLGPSHPVTKARCAVMMIRPWMMMIYLSPVQEVVRWKPPQATKRLQQREADGMRALLMSFAVVACGGAYTGLTTRAPQQLTLGAPLSRRATPAVAVLSTRRPKAMRPGPVEKPKVIFLIPLVSGPSGVVP